MSPIGEEVDGSGLRVLRAHSRADVQVPRPILLHGQERALPIVREHGGSCRNANLNASRRLASTSLVGVVGLCLALDASVFAIDRGMIVVGMDDSVATLGFVGLGVVGAALSRTELVPGLTSNAADLVVATLNSVLHLRVPELGAKDYASVAFGITPARLRQTSRART